MPGTITALVVQQKNKERVNVYLDGKFAFGLAAIEAARLRRGQVLSDADIDRLRNADDVEKAREKALRYLASRPRSEWEVRQNLKKAGFEAESVDRAVERLKDVALIDDAAFARYWVDNRTQFNPRSAAALRLELRRKGVDRTVIEAVLKAIDLPDESAALQAALARADRYRQAPRPEFTQKLGAYLVRRGFDYATAREAVDEAWRRIHPAAEAGNYPVDDIEE